MINTIKKSSAVIVVWFLLFFLIEGLCSTALVVQDFLSLHGHTVAQVHQIGYDTELGWVNLPNFFRRDYYNPGIYLKTDSKGFRNREEFDVRIPPNKLRVICSGDSFTFGTGVDNDHTWCQLLTLLDHRLQTINMGVPAYGFDQIHLWYLREGAPLDHDVQILAVIGDDFKRMRFKTYVGYGKPVLELRGDRLVPINVPVPKTSIIVRCMAEYHSLLLELRSLTALQRIVYKFRPPRRFDLPTPTQRELAAKVIERLEVINKQKKSTLVLVYLPVKEEYTAHNSSGAWRGFLRDEAAKQGITFVDFLDDTEKLPIADVEKLFIPEDSQYYASAAGHLSDYGNEYVARKLYHVLATDSGISAKLSQLP